MHTGLIRSKSCSLAEFVQRLTRPLLFAQGNAKCAVGFLKIGVKPERLAAFFDARIEVAFMK